MRELSPKAKIYIGTVIACGLAQPVAAMRSWHGSGLSLFVSILILTSLGSFLKVTISGITGSMSMNFIFILLGITRLSLGETLIVGGCATLVQTFWHRSNRQNAVQLIFNLALIFSLIGVTDQAYHSAWASWIFPGAIARLMLVSMIYFLLNTLAVAGVISMTGGEPLGQIWKGSYAWSFAYYLLGASSVAIFNLVEHAFGLELALLVLPIAFLAYRSYRMRVDSLEKARIYAEEQHKHADELATLHMRTIRALALAIEAKDSTTGEHLHRVQTYAVEIGRELGLPDQELNALAAASVLHDIGKIAVPEAIISKPGKLSKEEFDRMKIHALVGGEIVESVRFPYPVAPIVRAHHEKWDGTGYPCGLKGEQIPLGARILSAVDCLDALASDRQYRRALSLEQAMEFIASESAKAFDPKIVDILRRRCRELEALVRSTAKDGNLHLSLTARIERGAAPDAGLEHGREIGGRRGHMLAAGFLDSMADALAEAQLFEGFDRLLAQRGAVPELMGALTNQLRRSVSFDDAAFYLKDAEWLIPHFVLGADAGFLEALRIRIGTGLSGWVAEHKVPLLNGNPAAEAGLNAALPPGFSLRSALVIPLETEEGILGVWTLYSSAVDAFNGGHLRLCMGLRSRLAYALETALAVTRELSHAGAYPGCGLPNTGALLKWLDASDGITVVVARISGLNRIGDQQPLLSRIAAFVAEFGGERSFLARLGNHDFAAVFPHHAHHRSALESALARTIERSALQVAVICGSAESPADGTGGEVLLSVAASRMHARAVRDVGGGESIPCSERLQNWRLPPRVAPVISRELSAD